MDIKERMAKVDINRVWCMPNKKTFSIKAIKDLLLAEVNEGTWIDPFSNGAKVATITNDLNPLVDADYHMNAIDFLQMFGNEQVDGVLLDPPYSPRQVVECYKGFGREVTSEDVRMTFWHSVKCEVARIVKRGGKAICFGWNSMGIGKTRGFEMVRILLVAHGGGRNDTICTVEVKKYEQKWKQEGGRC